MDYLEKVRLKNIVVFIILAVILFATVMSCIIYGSVDIDTREVFQIIRSEDKKAFDKGPIIWNIRMPRVLAAMVGGAALAVAGLLLQIFFKNPIVEPYVLGISSGATLAVALLMLGGFALGFNKISLYGVFVAALIGSLIVTIIVVMFATKVKKTTTLLVLGIMLGYICSSITSILKTFADKEKLAMFTIWTMGSFSGMTWRKLKILVLMSLPALFVSLLIIKPLNALLMGEEYAISMGVNMKRTRIVIVTVSSVLAAAVTAFTGPVAFIGLAVPHIARLIFKSSDNKILIPGVMLLGGIITCLCDLLCRVIFAPVELPISAVTSIFGAPLVMMLIFQNKRGASL